MGNLKAKTEDGKFVLHFFCCCKFSNIKSEGQNRNYLCFMLYSVNNPKFQLILRPKLVDKPGAGVGLNWLIASTSIPKSQMPNP